MKNRSSLINLQTFYKFYNKLMQCLPIFYEHSILKRSKSKPKLECEDDLCCICEDKKSDIMLECYVNFYLFIYIAFFL